MKIYIKNMVCIRCKMVVKSELEKLDICFRKVELGEVEISDKIPQELIKQLDNNLRKYGLELIEDRKHVLVEKIKSAINQLVHISDEQLKTNLSDYLSEKLKCNYVYLANVFSEIMGISIEKFYIKHKIERVKELLESNELSIKEISYITRYSSISHMSTQFKKVAGLPLSQYRDLQHKNGCATKQLSC